MNGPTPAQGPLPPLALKLRSALPFLSWLPQYQPAWLRFDLLAGVTLAAYAIPVSLAYASLAGLPPQMGLYCYLVGGLGYALLGSSRHLAIGPTSAISLLFGATLAQLSNGDPTRLLPMATLTTLLVAALFALAWLLRLSVVINFISDSILTGFKAGAAIAIAATQLPKLLGVPGGGVDFFSRLAKFGAQLGQTNPVVLAGGVVAIVLLLLGEKWLPGRPVALIVVGLALGAVPLLGLPAHGVKVVGELPAGLPAFSTDWLHIAGLDVTTLRSLVGLAFACFLLSFIESVSAGRTFALKHQYDTNPRQELLGLGAANLLAGLFQGYPSAGGLSQSAVNEKAGARSPLSLLFASITLGAVLLWLTGLFANLPEVVLAAVVLTAVKGLIDLRAFRQLWRANRLDFYAALAALLGVVVLGILDGVIFAVIASLLMLLWSTATPHIAFLGRIPGTDRFSDLARHPDNQALPGVLAFRVEASLLYFNVDFVRQQVLERARALSDLKLVACDLSTSPYVDVAGARMLLRLDEELTAAGIAFKVAEAHAEVRDILRVEGLEGKIGHISRKVSLAEIIEGSRLGSV